MFSDLILGLLVWFGLWLISSRFQYKDPTKQPWIFGGSNATQQNLAQNFAQNYDGIFWWNLLVLKSQQSRSSQQLGKVTFEPGLHGRFMAQPADHARFRGKPSGKIAVQNWTCTPGPLGCMGLGCMVEKLEVSPFLVSVLVFHKLCFA